MRKYFYLLLLLAQHLYIYGQISPGDLAQAHAEYEGISNCTLCHDLGKKVSNAKCLDCHKDIQSLLSNNKGYHANKEVKNKDCFECHSDHHGRKFDMARFDEKKFNHDLTGYKLIKSHERIDCKDCHKPDFILDTEIRKRENTYLGLDDACLSCHEDYHQKTLSNDCAKCHDEEKFRPAPYFNHDNANYKLEGKHRDVDCKKCHKTEQKNGQDFQLFTNLIFNDCMSCHDDPHLNRLPGQCSKCHDVNSFSNFIGQRRFNHQKTKFNLIGQHKTTDCFECHKKTSNPKLIFQDKNGVKTNDCASCHQDNHDGKYGIDCAQCHTEKSFLALRNMNFFDHSVTHYKLEGKHLNVDCKQCHKGRYTDALDHHQCKNCHEDYHDGEFVTLNESPDCVDCHSLFEGFEYSLFGLDEHQKSQFPLNGAHIATPCFECHISEDDEKWKFKNIGESCVDCHDDIHKSIIDEKYYPEQNCSSCHSEESWRELSFDHNKTNWKLEGKHQSTSCRSCHFIPKKEPFEFEQLFSGLNADCSNCHDNIHDDQFAEDGVTNCLKCHDSLDWIPRKFDHNSTAFPLDGRHAELDCKACHKPENNSEKINFKIEKHACIDCHG